MPDEGVDAGGHPPPRRRCAAAPRRIGVTSGRLPRCEATPRDPDLGTGRPAHRHPLSWGHLWSPPRPRGDTTRPQLGDGHRMPNPPASRDRGHLWSSPRARGDTTRPQLRRRAPDAQPTGIPRSGAPLVASQGTRRHHAPPTRTTGPGALGIPANGGHLRSPPRPRGDPTRPRVTGIPPHPPASRNRGHLWSPPRARGDTTRPRTLGEAAARRTTEGWMPAGIHPS